MRGWARLNAEFSHMALWLEAELQQLRGASKRATALYRRAAQIALDREHPHHAALCLERSGHVLVRAHQSAEALLALSQAISHYRSWGAAAKGAALEQEITDLGLGRRSVTRRIGTAQP